MPDLILQAAVVFLVVIDPIGLLPVLLALTQGEDAATQPVGRGDAGLSLAKSTRALASRCAA